MSEVDERSSGGAGERPAGDPPGPAGGEAGPDPGLPGEAAGLPGDALTEAELEALLFVAERPLSRREIGALTGAGPETVDARLGDLEVSLVPRGIRLVAVADRVALATAPEAGRLIGRYVGGDQARLSPSMLETLAIVAYRQPVTRAGIERIRGVDSEYTLRSLLHRRLVVELGRAEAPGRPFLYGTGFDFLERFGLTSLADLPVLDAAVAQRLVEDAEAGRGPRAATARPASTAVALDPAPGPRDPDA